MREAHVRRIALGRGADEPPDWAALDQFVQLMGQDEPPMPGSELQLQQTLYGYADPEVAAMHQNQRFNERGRPVNTHSRHLDAEHCHAQNVAQQIAAASMAKETPEEQQQEYINALRRERKLCASLLDCFLWFEFTARHWMDAALHRWLALRPHGQHGFVHSIVIDWNNKSFVDFAFAGFIPFAVSAQAFEISDKYFTKLDEQLREVTWPSLPEYLGGATAITALRATSEVFFFGPLAVWAHLQTMGLIPSARLAPPLAFFNPLSSLSPFQPSGFSLGLLYSPLALRMAYDFLDKVVSNNFFIWANQVYAQLDDLALMLEEYSYRDDSPSVTQGPIVEEVESVTETHVQMGRPPRVWRVMRLTSEPEPKPKPIRQSLRKHMASFLYRGLNRLLPYCPSRPSTWRSLDPAVAFNRLGTAADRNSRSYYHRDLGPSPLHHSPTECADFLWRFLVMRPLYIVADSIVLRSLARGFLLGHMAQGLLANSTLAIGPADVYPILPSRPFYIWSSLLRPLLAEWALRASVGVVVGGCHSVLVGWLMRRRDAVTREALNWRDNGRRDWS